MPVLSEPAWAVVALALIVAVRDVALAWIASKAVKGPAQLKDPPPSGDTS